MRSLNPAWRAPRQSSPSPPPAQIFPTSGPRVPAQLHDGPSSKPEPPPSLLDRQIEGERPPNGGRGTMAGSRGPQKGGEKVGPQLHKARAREAGRSRGKKSTNNQHLSKLHINFQPSASIDKKTIFKATLSVD